VSNPARLILLSGTGGSGTSTIAAATLLALEGEGLRGVLIDVDESGAPSSQATAVVGMAVGALANWTGAGAVEPEAWSTLPTVRHVDAWLRVLRAREVGVDAVVVDCGDLRQARDFVALPLTGLRLLDRVMTPAVAMRRDSADRHDEDAEQSRGSAFEQFDGLRSVLHDAVAVLHRDSVMRLIAAPTEGSVSRVLRSASLMAMLGVDVDGIVLNRVARRADDLPERDQAAQRALMIQLEERAQGPLVWKSTAKPRAVPKGRSVLGPLGASPVLRADGLSVEADDEEYSLVVPLVGDAAREARVGRLGDDLAVAFDGLHRWLALPSVLKRCRAVEATRTPQGLRIAFVPDESLWRAASQAPGHVGAA
jgi:arsenite-transporting ATPase